MKRLLCLVLCILTAAAVCACGEEKIPPTEAPTEAVTEATAAETEKPTEATTSAAAEPDTKAQQKAFLDRFDDTPTVGDKLVYEDENLTVNLHGINYAPVAGPELHLTIDNRFGKDITVQAPYAVVNGYMITPDLSIDIPAEKTANGNLTLPYFNLAIADITCIKTIQFALRIVETKSYNPIFKTELITIRSSADQTAETVYNDNGQVAYDENDIRIVLQGVSTDRAYSDGAELKVYMYNGTDRTIAIQTGDVTVNGYDMTSVLNRVLLPDTHVVDVVTFYKMDMEEYNIDTIDSVKVSFEMKDADTWEEIGATDMISADLKQPETTAPVTESQTTTEAE